MFDELEALVGYVYVVGGRAVSATPPGALVELPPRKPQRGREQDTFFALVTPAGANVGQATFYEELARLAADLYFRTSGGVTGGLREAIGVVNNNLIEHNVVAGQRYEANMICLVLRGREVYVARAGACLCLLRQEDSFVTLPDDLHDEYALNALPLGYSPVADIKLAHYEVAPGHVMAFGDVAFAQANAQALHEALGGDGIQGIIALLKALGGAAAQAMVIQFVSVDTPDPVIQTAQPGAPFSRSSAAPASTPAGPLSATGQTTQKSQKAPAQKAAAPVKPVKPASTPVAKSTRGPEATVGERPAPKSTPIASPDAERPAPVVLPSIENAEEDRQEDDAAIEPQRPGSTPIIAGRNAVGNAASFLSIIARGLNGLLDRLLPEPDEEGPKIPAMLAAGVAIFVPVVIVFLVVAIRLSQVDMSEFEKTVQDVQSAADQAQAIPLTDVTRARAAWTGVIQRADNAEISSGRTGDPTLNGIRAQAQGILDGFDRVTRRDVTALRNFAEDTKLSRVIVQGSTSLYTLDVHAEAIYRDTLNPGALSLVERSTQPVVQKGQAVGAHAVKHLVDMTWMAEGGLVRANVIAALDSQGILVTYSPTFAPATSQDLQGAERWVKPVAITTWQGRLYVLDAGANQIWRYLPGGTSYPDLPETYFPDNFATSLKDAVDFDIDTTGNVYILFANGTMRRFSSGAEEQFSFNGLPDGKLKSASAMYLDTSSQLPGIYITDTQDQSVYKVTLAGTFQYRFRATDPGAFSALSGVYADQNRVYATSGTLVYTFTTPDQSAATPVR